MKIVNSSVDFQLRVPLTHEKNAIEQPPKMDPMDTEPKIGLIDFSRPSDFRMRAIEAKNLGFNSKGDDSHLSCTSKLSTIGTSSADSASSTAKSGNTPYEGLNYLIKQFASPQLKLIMYGFKTHLGFHRFRIRIQH